MTVAVYRFGEFTLNCQTFELSRRGQRLRLERKPLELLILLVVEHGGIVSREKIATCLWTEEVYVDIEHGINTAIRKIRQTLGDSPELPRFIQTVSGSGYRFIAPVTAVDPTSLQPALTEVQFAAPQITQPVPATSIEHPQAPPRTVAPPTVPATSEVSMAPSTPQASRWRRSSRLATGCGLVLIVVAVIAVSSRHRIRSFLNRDRRPTISSIAVLPLENLSGDSSQDYFADGMTDELITELARTPNLRVVSRTSVMASKGSSRSLPEIGRQLGVDAIVEGSIVRSGDRIRITAQLIDARTDRHLWAQSFVGFDADVLSIQDSVAQQIAAQASFVLTPPTLRSSINPNAHDAYLRGLYFFNKQDFSHSLKSFQQAVTLDPGYASAWAGYASALDAATTWGIGTPDELMPKALAAAQRAIQLDPQAGEAYTALGSVQTIYSWDWPAAEQNLTRGIALNPNDSIAEFKYAIYLDAVARPKDAVIHMRRALLLDPLSFLMNLRLGAALYYDHQYDAALAQMNRAAEMEQHSAGVDYWSSLIYEMRGDPTDAVQSDVKALHAMWSPQPDDFVLTNVYKKSGLEPYWHARTRFLLSTPVDSCTMYQVGLDDLRVKKIGEAFDSFQRAIDSHCFSMAFVRVQPLFDPVRLDPRYSALLKRMHQ